MTTALALASSKTNWSAIVPARAPPPPPPVTQATMLKRTHEIQCGKCAISDYAENIGVWNDDGTLQELGLCGECEEQYPICEICADECVEYGDKLCHGCYHNSEGAEECWCASAVDDCLTDRARDALKRFAEKEEEATTEFARNKICDECGCKGGCELTCVYVCGEPCEDIVGCCEKCDMEIVRDSDEHDNCLIGADDKFYCQHCPAAMCEMCESCYTNGGSISVLGRDISICENCDKGGDCYDGFLDEYHYNAETNDYEEKEDEPIPYCYENGKYSAPIPCGCPIPCAVASSDDESEEEDEQTCDGCGTTCLDHTSNKGRGSESPCEECEETRCKLCPCACEENQLLEEFWDGGMKEMWGEELREGHPLWEPFKLYKAMKKEQDA